MSAADFAIEMGIKYPYNGRRPEDWAETAALGILADLGGRRGIKHEIEHVDLDVRDEIVLSLAEIIRMASKEQAMSHETIDNLRNLHDLATLNKLSEKLP